MIDDKEREAARAELAMVAKEAEVSGLMGELDRAGEVAAALRHRVCFDIYIHMYMCIYTYICICLYVNMSPD